MNEDLETVGKLSNIVLNHGYRCIFIAWQLIQDQAWIYQDLLANSVIYGQNLEIPRPPDKPIAYFPPQIRVVSMTHGSNDRSRMYPRRGSERGIHLRQPRERLRNDRLIHRRSQQSRIIHQVLYHCDACIFFLPANWMAQEIVFDNGPTAEYST